MAAYLGDEWNNLMSKRAKKFDTKELIESELRFTFLSLTHTVQKKASLFWHIKSFEDYLKIDINPFGLRVQIFPSFERIEPEFKVAWEKVLKQCSANLMNLLIQEYRRKITELY